VVVLDANVFGSGYWRRGCPFIRSLRRSLPEFRQRVIGDDSGLSRK